MLRLRLAPGFRAEQEYIASVLLGDFLGLSYEIDGVEESPVASLRGEGRTLLLPQVLFSGEDSSLAAPGRLPGPACSALNVECEGLPPSRFCSAEIPVLYGGPPSGGRWIVEDEAATTLHADVFGGAFFCLARLEEIASAERDAHGCFPASASLASRADFLDRPVVNEYAEILFAVMQRLWPGLRRSPRTFRVQLSHDVDRPFAYRDLGPRDRLWSLRDARRRRTLPALGGSTLLNAALAMSGLPHRDPFDTFDWMMDQEERAGLRSVFYFLASSDTPYDARYSLESRRVRALVRRIHERGHEIGLHASYSSFLSAEQIGRELRRLETVMKEEGIAVTPLGSRQHYLRWQAPHTWRACEEAGLRYDASVGFNQIAGFRCGTCYEFPVFDAETRRALALRERPLMIMDVTLLSPLGMGLDLDAGRQVLRGLSECVKRFSGTLELLWHNNHFCEDRAYAELYRDSLTL